MKKLIKDGNVAVLISYGYGAGWSTWGDDDMAFEPVIAQMLLDNKPTSEMLEYLDDIYPDFYTGGLDGLSIEWIPEGIAFSIEEYDGSESLRTVDMFTHTA